MDLLTAAAKLSSLASWTRLESDPALATFKRIFFESDTIPFPFVKELWSPHARAEVETKITAFEAKWQSTASDAASRLIVDYAWSLEARRALRRRGVDVDNSSN